MTAIARPAFLPRIRPVDGLRSLVRGRADEAAWVRPAFLGVLALAALLYLWNLTVSGYANTYYSAASLAASKSWAAWFFGSFDASNFITVDKPPLSTMVMGLSVRLFGLSSWSVLAPEALAGVGTVGVLFLAVKRSFGPAAATIAAIVAFGGFGASDASQSGITLDDAAAPPPNPSGLDNGGQPTDTPSAEPTAAPTLQLAPSAPPLASPSPSESPSATPTATTGN